MTVETRRLRFDLDLMPDESIQGALFRAACDHVMETVFPILAVAGIDRKRLRTLQLAPPAELRRLAEVIRCDPRELSQRAGKRLKNASGRDHGRQMVNFQDLTMDSNHFDRNVRRLSPLGISQGAYYRSDWLNVLLPYCPASLGLVIDECGRCDRKLGWSRPHGLAVCDKCGSDLHSDEIAPLGPEQVECYKSFADLCSLDAERGRRALATLPSELRELTRGELTMLALRSGMILGEESRQRIPDTHFRRLPADLRAKSLADGMQLLKGWPGSLFARVESLKPAGPTARSGRPTLWSDMRWIGKAVHDVRYADTLQRLALPTIERTKPEAAKSPLRPRKRRYEEFGGYSVKAASQRLRSDLRSLNILRQEGLVPFFERGVNRQGHRQGYFPSSDIDRIAEAFERSVPIWQFCKRFDLPGYAIEQLASIGLLQAEAQPAIIAIRGEIVLHRDGLESAAEAIATMRKKRSTTSKLVPLSRLSQSLGGGLKPWGAIYRALLDGSVPFWTRADGMRMRDILMRPSDWAALSAGSGLHSDKSDFPFRTYANQFDVMEILNEVPSTVRSLHVDGMLPYRRWKLSKRSELADVLAIAGNWISRGELMKVSGRGNHMVDAVLRKSGVVTRCGMWERTNALKAMESASVNPKP